MGINPKWFYFHCLFTVSMCIPVYTISFFNVCKCNIQFKTFNLVDNKVNFITIKEKRQES